MLRVKIVKRLLLKISKILAACFAAILFLILNGCGVDCMFERAPMDAQITSPNKTYEIRLKEQIHFENSFMTCYGDHKVIMNVTKNNQPFVSDEVIDSGDGMDGRFAEVNAFWFAENVLSFSGQPKNYENHSEKPDEIKVINQTDKVIKNLNVEGGGRFVVFDLMPNSEVVLQTSSQTPTGKFQSLSWISCLGRFADGEKLSSAGENFKVGGKNISTTHYSIIIKDSGVEIESADFKKLERNPLPTQTPILKLTSEL